MSKDGVPPRGGLDWGRVGDVIDGLTLWEVEQRRIVEVYRLKVQTGMKSVEGERREIGEGWLIKNQSYYLSLVMFLTPKGCIDRALAWWLYIHVEILRCEVPLIQCRMNITGHVCYVRQGCSVYDLKWLFHKLSTQITSLHCSWRPVTYPVSNAKFLHSPLR